MNIRILSNTLGFVGEIDNYESFFVVLNHGDMSMAQVTIRADKNNADLLVKGNYIYAADDTDHVFIITDAPKSYDAKGEVLHITAYDVFWIFKGRITNTGTSALTHSSKTVEYIVKDWIDTAIISATDADRQISILTTKAGTTLGSTINSSVSQTPLDEDIKQLLSIDELGLIGAYDSVTPSIEVDLYEGEDRSVNNTDSNSPVIFDVKYDNIISGEEKDSNANVKNFAYVLGVDTDGTRIVEEYGTATGISRRELAVDAGDISASADLQNIGKANLISTETGITANVDALRGSFDYGTDYFLGDIVTIIDNDLRLLTVERVWEQGKPYQLYLTFGQKPRTTESKVSNNTARIERLETKIVNSGTSGWISSVGWEYVSATTATITGDKTEDIQKGDKIRFKQGGGYKYNYIVATPTYNAGTDKTTITISSGYQSTAGDSSFANSAITDAAYSHVENPMGFPDWFNYTATPTGFSVQPTGIVAKFKLSGKSCYVIHFEAGNGTSNANTFTVPLPVSAKDSGAFTIVAAGRAVDNGATVNTAAVWLDAANSVDEVKILKEPGVAVWTTSGDRRASFQMFYDI